MAHLETELVHARLERDELLEINRKADEEVTTLRRVVQHHEQESKNRQSMFESKIAELENVSKTIPKGSSSTYTRLKIKWRNLKIQIFSVPGISDILKDTPQEKSAKSDSSVIIPPPPAPVAAPPPPPCPPPPPVKTSSAPIPPPPAGFMQAPDGAMTIKRKVQTKYKLPTINWVALKPNQVKNSLHYFFH